MIYNYELLQTVTIKTMAGTMFCRVFRVKHLKRGRDMDIYEFQVADEMAETMHREQFLELEEARQALADYIKE